MARDSIQRLIAFVAVARERSFTRAAARLGVSQSALSHSVRTLESDMGVRLLTRTTRSVEPTEAGERLLRTLEPRFEEIDTALTMLGSLGGKPAGTVRIRSTDYAADTVLRPGLAAMLATNPALMVEISIDDGPGRLADEHYDIGVRWGDQVAKEMVAVRIAPDCRMAIVGSPAYLASHPRPSVPQDLLAHNCVTLRLPDGTLAAWDLQDGSRNVPVRVEGQVTFNGVYPMLNAALSGCGLALVPEDLARPHIDAGRLGTVLEGWVPTVPGLHLYHAQRLSASSAVMAVVRALRLRP